MKFLVALFLGFLIVPKVLTKTMVPVRKAIEEYYSPLDMCKFRETKWVDCNHCRCLWTWAMWSCTKNVCSPLEMRGKRKECYHGQRRQEGCNMCECQYGRWACGLKLCNAECRDGSMKVMECNTCHCIGGRYRCTEYPCIFHDGHRCEPKSRSTMNCNECVCNKTGMGLTCTIMDCF